MIFCGSMNRWVKWCIFLQEEIKIWSNESNFRNKALNLDFKLFYGHDVSDFGFDFFFILRLLFWFFFVDFLFQSNIVYVGKRTTILVNDWYQTALMNNHSMNLYVHKEWKRYGDRDWVVSECVGLSVKSDAFFICYRFHTNSSALMLNCRRCCCRRCRCRLHYSSSMWTSNDFWFNMSIECMRATSSNSGKSDMCVCCLCYECDRTQNIKSPFSKEKQSEAELKRV